MISISRYIIILLLSGLLTALFGQPTLDCTIKGKVVDSNTGEPLHLVNVYLSGTTFGASTSVTGEFCVENVTTGSYQLIFQHIGYRIEVKDIFIEDNNKYELNVQLSSKIFSSDEIQISATIPEEWQKHLEFFIKEFVGESDNAEYCEILNPEVLNFKIEEESSTFSATSDSVIRILNNSLGYQINLVLVEFRCKNDNLSTYSIYPNFVVLQPKDEDEQDQWIENREKTYISSFKHFLSTLARRKMNEENFNLLKADNIISLKKGHGKFVTENSLRIEDTRLLKYKKFFSNDFISVSYSPAELFPPSIIKIEQDYVVIDTLGNLITPEYVKMTGEWQKKRVGDLLPMEYLPDN